MRICTLTFALGALAFGSSVTTAKENPSQARKCGYTVQQAANRDKSSSFKKGQGAPMRLRAVDRKVDGCPVLVMADSGKTIEPPSFTGAPAKKSPAR